MPIIPDQKDWTWVLQAPCPECGFEAESVTPATAASSLPALVARWRAVLRRPEVAERPSDDCWSALEYGCHVRDLFEIFNQRLNLMLTEDNPLFANWDQDQTALERDYARQDPAEVSAAGAEIAQGFAAVRAEQWPRPGRRSNGSVFTVRTFSGYFLHDVVHHLHDVDG